MLNFSTRATWGSAGKMEWGVISSVEGATGKRSVRANWRSSVTTRIGGGKPSFGFLVFESDILIGKKRDSCLPEGGLHIFDLRVGGAPKKKKKTNKKKILISKYRRQKKSSPYVRRTGLVVGGLRLTWCRFQRRDAHPEGFTGHFWSKMRERSRKFLKRRGDETNPT